MGVGGGLGEGQGSVHPDGVPFHLPYVTHLGQAINDYLKLQNSLCSAPVAKTQWYNTLSKMAIGSGAFSRIEQLPR